MHRTLEKPGKSVKNNRLSDRNESDRSSWLYNSCQVFELAGNVLRAGVFTPTRS